MADLDYAYLAEFARVERGTITAVGASFTQVVVPALPWQWRGALAARIRASEDEGPVTISVQVLPPNGSYELQFMGDIQRDADVQPYQGKVGLLLAVDFQVPLNIGGLHVVNLGINGVAARRLAFDVSLRT